MPRKVIVMTGVTMSLLSQGEGMQQHQHAFIDPDGETSSTEEKPRSFVEKSSGDTELGMGKKIADVEQRIDQSVAGRFFKSQNRLLSFIDKAQSHHLIDSEEASRWRHQKWATQQRAPLTAAEMAEKIKDVDEAATRVIAFVEKKLAEQQ
ncbi:unnamed protein product [Amoebophrya sp. A25]|nr:unnamed protein product [Amoebophrya sp. A25]|eukprot:GSA25T00007977001.1